MGLEELEAAWNAQADRYNQWCELGLDEIVEFAQQIEREACAQIAERAVERPMMPVLDIAMRIRERSNVV